MSNCMTNDEKVDYLHKINKFYNFDMDFYKIKKILDEKEYKICDGSELKKVKLFSESTVNKLLKLMDKTIKFLDDNSIDYWIDSGTLLGACRDGKFIPWDDDIDLAIPHDSFIKIQQIIKDYPEETVSGNTYKISKKYDIKFWEEPVYAPVDKSKPFLIKTFNLNEYLHKEDVFIDLMNYFCFKNYKYISNVDTWKNKYMYLVDDIYPLKTINFEGRKLKCVKNPKNFLNTAYLFWKDLALASHAHFKELKDTRSKYIFFTLR